MELDKKQPLEYRQSKEEEQKDVEFIVRENKYADMFPDGGEAAMLRFGGNLSRLMNDNLGIDKGKSYNPLYDKLEKGLNRPEAVSGTYQQEVTKVTLNIVKEKHWYSGIVKWFKKWINGGY